MRKTQRPSPLKKEIVALFFFTFSLIMLLSLISYNPTDPSFSFYQTSRQKIHNLLGVTGAYLSDLMLQVFGLGSFLLVLIFFQFSLRVLFTLRLNLRFLNIISSLFLVFSACGILSLGLERVSLGNFSGNGGGLLGDLTSRFLTKYFNIIGAYILLLFAFTLSLMVSTGLSFSRSGNYCLNFFFLVKKGVDSLSRNTKRFFLRIRRKKIWQKVFFREKEKNFSPSEENGSQNLEKEPAIITPASKISSVEATETTADKGFPYSGFKLPPLALLKEPKKEVSSVEKEILIENSRLLEKKLSDYGVKAKVINVHPGPIITRYELEPAPGVKISRIVNLADDLALALKAIAIRIIAPIPGKAAIGVEIPNKNRQTVYFKEIVTQEEFLKSDSPLTLGLGKDISGTPIITVLSNLPHLLIAGTTGSGKSVFINAMICSILYKALPSEVKLLIMDPKRSELSFYNDIPHLLYPVVTDAKQAAEALRWAVEEMERRYQLLAKMGTRDIKTYNMKVGSLLKDVPITDAAKDQANAPNLPEKMPWIVIVIDELANLMMVSSREVEWSLSRLAQMARAAGMHLLVATQRPSVDVITGTIKANFPARISFRLTSKTDSRIIIDTNGAENLLNHGDMLFLSPRTPTLKRIHGPYISDEEIIKIVNFLKAQAEPEYQELHLESVEEEVSESFEDIDEKYREAVKLVTSLGQASISLIQRKLRIGYNRAARIIEKMEEEGIVGPSDGVKPREVLRKMVDI